MGRSFHHRGARIANRHVFVEGYLGPTLSGEKQSDRLMQSEVHMLKEKKSEGHKQSIEEAGKHSNLNLNLT